MAKGACVGSDIDFFPASMTGSVAERAKALCARCAVREDCLRFALDNREPDGIWGGTTPGERRRRRRHSGSVDERVAAARAVLGPKWVSSP